MTDQNEIDTKTANAWADLYRYGGKVDFDEAMEVIHNAPGYMALAPLILQALQQPERREGIADAVLEALMGFVRDEFADKVQDEPGPKLEACEINESEKMEDYRERMNGNA